MAKKKKEIEEAFYVQVNHPLDIKRSLLESSREVLRAMQRFEKYKKIEAEKEKKMSELKRIGKTITASLNKINKELPKYKVRAQAKKKYTCTVCGMEFKSSKELASHKKIAHKPVKMAKTKVVKEKVPELNELEKLEAELSDIESKLRTLS